MSLPFPVAHVFSHETDKSFDLGGRDVLLEQLAVVVQQGRDGVLGENVVADLLLHKAEMLGEPFLQSERYIVKSQN